METEQLADPEVATFWHFIASSLDRLVALALALDETGLAWRPPGPETNSVHVLTIHTLGNAEENILQTLCGTLVGREHDAEFTQAGAAVAPGELDRARPHPRRGTLSGRAVLIVVARHAAEHLGQAELTRDLWRASRA